jgi:hypothetical protein
MAAADGGASTTITRTFGIKVKIKGKVKGNGQECPFHACKSNINVKSGASGVCGSHLSQKRRKMGHPRLVLGRRSQDPRQRQPAGVSVVYGRRFASLTGEAAVSIWFVVVHADSRFLLCASRIVGMTKAN